jgi:hypothetical protein
LHFETWSEQVGATAGIWRAKFIAASPKITYCRTSADHDDLVFEESGRHPVRVQRPGEVNGREGVLRSIVINPALHRRFSRLARGWRAQNLDGFPGRTRNVAGPWIQLADGVIGIHWPESEDSPPGRRLSEEFERRNNSLLVYSSHLLHDLERPAQNRLSEILQRACKGGIPGRVRRRGIENEVIDDETRAIIRQALEQWHVQSPVPDVVDRLVQSLCGFLVEVNEHYLVGVEIRSPNKGQVVAAALQWFCEAIPTRKSGGDG